MPQDITRARVGTLSARLGGGFRHCWPWAAVTATWVPIWPVRYPSDVVPIAFVGQDISCHLCQQHFIDHIHRLFGSTRFRAWPLTVRSVCGWPCRHYDSTWCQSSFICWRYTAVPALSWWWHHHGCHSAERVHRWYQPLIRPSCFGLGRDIIYFSSRAMVQLWNLVRTLFCCVTMFGCLESHYQQIWVSTITCPLSARSPSTGYVSVDESAVHSMHNERICRQCNELLSSFYM